MLDVRQNLSDPSWGPGRFLQGHLPGAVHLPLDGVLSGPVRADGLGGRHPWPEADAFSSALRAAGVCTNRPVVLYDDPWASRAWLLLVWLGHPHVRVLDGGLAGWVAAGGELEVGSARPRAPGDFLGQPEASWLADRTDAAQAAAEGRLVDVREPVRFRGEHEPVDRVAGHAPGARNLPWKDMFLADGAPAGPPLPEGAVFTCGSGVTACVGVRRAVEEGRRTRVYTGSWSDWIAAGGSVALGHGA